MNLLLASVLPSDIHLVSTMYSLSIEYIRQVVLGFHSYLLHESTHISN